MAFRIRDLMINVMPQRGGPGGGGEGCFPVSCGDLTANCDAGYTCGFTCINTCDFVSPVVNCGAITFVNCGAFTPCGVTCGVTPCAGFTPCGLTCHASCQHGTHRCLTVVSLVVVTTNPNVKLGVQEFAALKDQLRAALAEIETKEEAVAAAARPRTREQAEELEEKLEGALAEVRDWKRTLPGGESE